MCRVVEGLEVELKALSPALLTHPPPPLHVQCFREGCLFFMGQQDQVQRDGKKLDPRVYKAPGWKAALEGKTVFALAGNVPLKLLSHQCTGFAVTQILLDHEPLVTQGSGGIAIPVDVKEMHGYGLEAMVTLVVNIWWWCYMDSWT